MRSEDPVNYFSKPAGVVEQAPSLADGRPPRGLTAEGWVRTTGWLQFGRHPVSSAYVAALAGLLWGLAGAAGLVDRSAVAAGALAVTTPVLCAGSWWLFTTRLRPASSARNVATKHADELAPGDVVRLHGSIGPVGQVTAVTFGEKVQVHLHGGGRRSWARRRTTHIAELLS